MHSIFWFRTRQWVLSRVLHLTEHKKQTLLAAPDAVLLLPALFRKRRISRILLVTTPGFVRRGTLTSLLDGCKKENISVTIFSEIAPDPQIESVEQGFRLYQQIQAQAILAIGGGSVLDTAKLIGARVCCPKKTVPAMRGLLKVRRKRRCLPCRRQPEPVRRQRRQLSSQTVSTGNHTNTPSMTSV